MTTITTCVRSPTNTAIAATPTLRRTYKRASGPRALAAGYRLMAWHALRKDDAVTAAMHAACSKAFRNLC